MRKSLIALAFVPVIASTSSQAQIIASENFAYSPGTAVIAAEGTGGTGWAYGWNSKSDTSQTQVMGTSLGYTDGLGNTLATSGGSLISSTTTGTTAQPERALSSTLGALGAANTTSPGTVWMSYLWQGLNLPSTSGGLYRQSIMMFINGATSSVGSGSERLDVGMPNISTANQATVNPNISLWTSGGISGGNVYTSLAPLQSGVAANSGLTTFVLVEFNVDNVTTTADSVSIWLNPNLTGAVPGGLADLVYTNQDLSAINAVRIQSGGLNASYGTVGGAQQVDEIRFGNTVGDVEPLAVPEPSSFALATLGGMALLAWRRRLAA